VFAIILAFYSFGYWALVARELSRAIFVLFGTWFACPWRPSFPRRNTQIRHLLVFAKNVTGFNLVHFLSHSVDKILLGKLHGPYWVGVYINASQFLSLPINQLKAPLFTVGLPALSPLQSEPSSFHATFEKIAQLLTFFSMPIILFLALFGDVIVVLLLGTKWVKAVPIFRVLAVGAFLEPLVHMTGLAMVASGRTSQYFRMGTINASFLLSSLFIGSYWGVMGITAAYSFSTYLSLITCLVYGLKHTPIRVIPLLRRLAPNFFCSLATALLFLYARYAIGWEYASSWIALYAVAAVITYLGLCLIVPGGKEMMWSYWNYARTVMPKMRG
jgi:PST family polysaccharide transporter